MNSRDGVQDLDRQIGLLEADLAVPSEREVKEQQLADLKRQKKDRDHTQVHAEARKRLLDIQRSLGSLADLSTKDSAKLREAARAFAEAVVTLNERYERCIALRHEAATLCEVFELTLPTLPTVVVPALRPEVEEAFEITSRVGVRDNGYVPGATDTATGRRTYAETELGETTRDLIHRKVGG